MAKTGNQKSPPSGKALPPAKATGTSPTKPVSAAVPPDMSPSKTSLGFVMPTSANRKVAQRTKKDKLKSESELFILRVTGDPDSEGFGVVFLHPQDYNNGSYAGHTMFQLVRDGHSFDSIVFQRTVNRFHRNYEVVTNGKWIVRLFIYLGPVAALTRKQLFKIGTMIKEHVVAHPQNFDHPVHVNESNFLHEYTAWNEIMGNAAASSLCAELHDITGNFGVEHPEILHTFFKPGSMPYRAAQRFQAPIEDLSDKGRAEMEALNGADAGAEY